MQRWTPSSDGSKLFALTTRSCQGSLAEVGVPAHGEWTFTKTSANEYRVVLRMYGQVVTFDSRQRTAPLKGRPLQ